MYDWILSYEFTGFVIANKADKISKSKYKTNVDLIMKTLNIKDRDLIIPFSSEKKINIDIVREQIENIVKYGSGFDE